MPEITEVPDLLDALCLHFDEELERQENVLAVTRAQGLAARAGDRGQLESKTAALSLLVNECVAAERRRLELLQRLVAIIELPEAEQTMTGLIRAVPQPWKRRLEEFQSRIRAVLRETRWEVRQNSGMFRRALRLAGRALLVLTPQSAVEQARYNQHGQERAQRFPTAALIDTRG